MSLLYVPYIANFKTIFSCSYRTYNRKVRVVSTLSTFEKLGFPFYTSYCHLKTVPPMNIFDFFTLNQLRKSGPFHIWPFWPYMNFPR